MNDFIDLIQLQMDNRGLTMEQLYDAVNAIGKRKGYMTFVGGLEWHGEERIASARDGDTELAYHGA
ncbi:hypothetical protein [Alicyclobacillus dauci]|uniref:Uncharacterized protein n=1 Tax=Alicyclobacillus dauci TaxID=1475485 RepID=A0ABY6YZ90_9BACL|nr:hypothetical protein [Alicyclobacillus dauci]WAH35015.1 hypothetical protein NZD86_11815 [Alicyclobacillus dauci]